MAFTKFANATLIRPDIHMDGWSEVRANAMASSAFGSKEAAHVVLQEYDPKIYLLSHCTIIASVDTEDAGQPLGRNLVDSFQVDRRYPDWLITPQTDKYANNNNDAWERKLLLSCFKTFVGGENYVEHIQIPELSKGKIIDAAARDIGDSVYVDILIATDRRHRPLISAITSKQLSTLSMGCQVEFTICTKCGNVAYDETQLCPHVRYMKGNTFVDTLGKKRKIAELCGHRDAEPGSVKFIEASWVANPAFTGAVLRNILTAEETAKYGHRIQVAFSQPARVPDPSAVLKAARLRVSEFGEEDTQVPGTEPQEEPQDPLDKAVDELTSVLREKVIERVRADIGKDESKQVLPNENSNDTIIKSALRNPSWRKLARSIRAAVGDPKRTRRILLGLVLYRQGGWKAVKASGALEGRDVLAVSRLVDLSTGTTRIAGENRIYRVVLAAGDINGYPNTNSYLAACRRLIGRELTDSETEALIDKGRLFALGS